LVEFITNFVLKNTSIEPQTRAINIAMKYHLLFILLLCSLGSNADFLIVKRTGNLRASFNVESEVLEKLKVGDTLEIVHSKLQSGYYNVVSISSGQRGWVYQTLVTKVTAASLLIKTGNPTGDHAVVDIRVLDIGAGLCSIIKLPNNKYVIYDAGGDSGREVFSQIENEIKPGTEIELLVLSHTDQDHIKAAAEVLDKYKVKKILSSGFDKSKLGEQSTLAFKKLVAAIARHPETENVNLNELDSTITPGNGFKLGHARFTFLCGFGKPQPDWILKNNSEKLNSVSIVMKLEYGDGSVLFCGDALGRHLDDKTEDNVIATEKFMLDNASEYLPSKIVIAPHHGARNGSTMAFVKKVNPEYVIFSAGHDYRHPDERTAKVYLKYMPLGNVFRTDLGDDEGGTEWKEGRIKGSKDPLGDDPVQIQLKGNGGYRVFYVRE